MGQYRLDEVKEKAIFDFVVAATASISGLTNKKIIWDKQDVVAPRNAKKPALPYVTLNISSGPTSQGVPELKYKELDTYTFPMRRAFTLTVNVFSNLAWLEIAQIIKEALELPTKKAILRQGGVSVNGIPSDVLDISALLDTKHEGRATFDSFYSYVKEVDDAPGEVQKVEHTNEITGTTIQTDINEPIIIP